MTENLVDIHTNLASLIKDPSLEKLGLSLLKPNIFNILRIKDSEVRHSNFLAWLLDPKGSHNLRDIFVRWFLKDVFADIRVTWANEFMVDSMDTGNIRIHRELHNIDLVLVAIDFVLVIENKMWSKDHSDQLARYERTISKTFPDIKKAFVFLTPYGAEPRVAKDADVYVNYGYSSIVRILDIIIDIYGNSISPAVKNYIEDYICILKRDIMKEDEVIKIAQKIYDQHRNALDFIFENKPDLMSGVGDIFLSAIKSIGYIPETQNKGYARFLTKELHDVIPRTGLGGWKNKEQFLFEIDYWPKNITLRTIVAPGNPKNRAAIINALMTIDGAKTPKTELWSTIHSHKHIINIHSEKYEDTSKLEADIIAFLKKEDKFIQNVSNVLMQLKNDFEY